MQIGRVLSLIAIAMAVLAAWLVPAPALASSDRQTSSAPSCHAASDLNTSLADMMKSRDWTCADSDRRASDPVAWLRFDRAAWIGEERPRYFYTRNARHSAITLAAIDTGGAVRMRAYREDDGRTFAAGPVFALALPEITEQTKTLMVRIERPHSIPLLTEARLTNNLDNAEWSQLDMMLIALVVGMLVLPLLFDISFFVVLRERFIMIHAAMVVSMMIYVLFASGLISAFVTLPVAVLAIVAPLVWALGMGLSLFFFTAFVERDAQSRVMRRLTLAAAWWTLIVPSFFALQLHATQAFDDRGYFLAFLPAMAIIPASLAEAIYRGSQAARFLAVAWLPILLAAFERFARGVGLYTGPSTLDQLIYMAAAFEVIVISVAIAYRFLNLRRERDAALMEAETHERLSERDPLTGLMNRRAVEDRFDSLRAQGFDTFALIDLDRFKQINDRFGHQVGDQTLISCANAIRGGEDRDEVAVRLGGEEFVVLLRGENTLARAEKLRQAIPLRIAREVEGLDRVVTASMGLIEIPHDASAMMDFAQLYARADKLLYEAKATGRNRTTYERLKLFNTPPAPRPRAATGKAA